MTAFRADILDIHDSRRFIFRLRLVVAAFWAIIGQRSLLRLFHERLALRAFLAKHPGYRFAILTQLTPGEIETFLDRFRLFESH